MLDIFALHNLGTPSAYIADSMSQQEGVIAEQVRRFLREQEKLQRASSTLMTFDGPGTGVGNPVRLETLVNYTPQVSAPVAKSSDALTAIRRLRTVKNYNDDWDGEGAPAPDPDYVEAAITLIGFLASEPVKITAMLDGIGRPLVLISRGAEEGEITMTSPTSFDFVWFAVNEDAGDVDVAFDGRRLPDPLKVAIAIPVLAAA